MQWSGLTEEKKKNQLAQTEFRFIKTMIITNNNEGRRQLLVGLRLHISVATEQKMANCKVAFASRPMQWREFPEEKQKD
jgi:hypothetical protein